VIKEFGIRGRVLLSVVIIAWKNIQKEKPSARSRIKHSNEKYERYKSKGLEDVTSSLPLKNWKAFWIHHD